MGEGPNSSGGSRKYLIDALDASLRRLQTDYVDLYQMHGPDRSTPIHETLRALDDMVTAGKVRYIGCSNFPGWEIVDAVWTSRTERLAHFVSCQPPYNILDRGIEAEILPACRRYGLGILPYYPLASGFLTGKYDQGNAPPEGTRLHFFPNIAERHLTEEKFASLGRLQEFARRRGHSTLELAIAWLLANPQVSSVISGASTAEQVRQNVFAAEWQLTPEDINELDAIAPA